VADDRRQRIFAGWAAVALGVFGIVMMVQHPENARAPGWVAYAAVTAFIFAGAGLLAGVYGTKRAGDWISLGAVVSLLVTAAWVSFGPGPRNCKALLFFVSATAGDWLCRGAFGLGTLLLVLICVLMVRRLLR
jgi:hypothetical protein